MGNLKIESRIGPRSSDTHVLHIHSLGIPSPLQQYVPGIRLEFREFRIKQAPIENEWGIRAATDRPAFARHALTTYRLVWGGARIAPVQVLVDEAKLREDALKAQVLSFEKDNCALKEQKKFLLQNAKDWQEKHVRLSEEIKVYHKTQTELENALVRKENEIEVLSRCIAELKKAVHRLEPCNNEELGNDKNGDLLKLHLKQTMDVLRIKATLSVIEDERNRWFKNFMAEQKKVMHDQMNMKNEKTHLENQYKNLQQRLEITTELYHQKENILHQTLSEVDGRALQAEEELNLLRQKVKDMQAEMQQNERSLKAEIAVQEKKANENWLKARASEQTLIEEKRECANLRQNAWTTSERFPIHGSSTSRHTRVLTQLSQTLRLSIPAPALPLGTLPPPGTMVPPAHGPAPPTPPQPRGGQDMPHAPPEQQRALHDTPPPSGTQS
ncbi:melanoma inhibitory activity protein 3 isoform X4 [Silurus asotus]|uniref:Melanoma inhibitory activity protein 3 isoform X4 n=1 Tax=Silurus asotus TaxID=30991 RepID=A0AAD5B4P0_SILAS|nr:melanoma inhibitory activity protein 3 isoform X4 [Silurus asotus]